MTVWHALIIVAVTTLIGVLGWIINKILAVNEELSKSINKLNLSITGMNGVLLSIQEGGDSFSQSCHEKHTVVDARLNEHSRRLNEHEKKLVEIDTKVNIG